jgi:hypothetical protein
MKFDYGVILTTHNDIDLAEKALTNLIKANEQDHIYVSLVDGNSKEEELSKLYNITKSTPNSIIALDQKNLSDALNKGYTLCLEQDCPYIFWVHQDMRFPYKNWCKQLIFCYEFCWERIGLARLGPGTRNIDGSCPSMPLRGGNQCPHVMSATFLKEFKDRWGYIYNPEYINIGGMEDWDMGQRIIQMGYGFGICSLVDVWHEGMGTRKLRDTNADAIYNKNVYYNHWKTWEQPGFEVDMTDLGKELKEAFIKEFGEQNCWWNNLDKS